MADIFHEIDEDLRRERFNRVWSRYGVYVIGVAVLVVLGVAGWRGYEWWKLTQDQEAGARFEQALQLAVEGKTAEAEASFAALEKDGTAGYRTLARFRSAVELGKTDRAAAVADYDAIAADGSVRPLMRDVARVRAALLLVDTAPLADIDARIKPLDTPTGAFRHSAREILGLAQYKAGDTAAASATFAAILGDPETPPGLRRRAELMRVLAAGGVAQTATPDATLPATGTPAEAPVEFINPITPVAPATSEPAEASSAPAAPGETIAPAAPSAP